MERRNDLHDNIHLFVSLHRDSAILLVMAGSKVDTVLDHEQSVVKDVIT